MGKYFAEFFERNGYQVIISGRKTPLSNIDVAKKADVVIVTVPIDITRDIIHEIAPHVRKDALLMDFTSLKEFPIKAMLKSKASVIGLHPLFGATNAIEGQVVVMCPARPGKWKPWIKNLLESNKVIVRELTPAKHDEMMSYVQVLTHFSNIAMADTLQKANIPIETFLKYQSPVYREKLVMMGRILSQDPHMYADIQILNSRSHEVLADYLESCKQLKEIVNNDDASSFTKIFKRASKYLGEFTDVATDESTRLIDLMYGKPAAVTTVAPKKGEYDMAVLGPKNTYSDLAIKKFKPKAKVFYAPAIAEVVEMVEKGIVKEGFVPIENNLTGSVRETLDELFERNVSIQKVMAFPIHLALVAHKKLPLKNIKTVYSHPQPLMQTRHFLRDNLHDANLVPMASTVAALERIERRKQSEAAAIASIPAAKSSGLTIIHKNIEDNKANTTFFALITKKPTVSPKAKRTSLAFTFSKDSPGTLFTVLEDFAGAGINLTKIESRPNPKVHGEYVFYIDFDGNAKDSSTKQVLTKVKKKVAELKILGCYELS